MKLLVTLIIICSTGCSATLLNQKGGVALNNPCEWSWIPYVDLAASSVAAGMAIKNRNDEFARNAAIMAASGFAISALMGTGELYHGIKCHQKTE